MSNTLPFGTPVICISHNNFKQTRGRVLGFDPVNSKYFVKINEGHQLWLTRELVIPVEQTNCRYQELVHAYLETMFVTIEDIVEVILLQALQANT